MTIHRLAFASHLIIAVVAGALAACPPPIDGCTVGATRCAGQSAQVCDSDQRWSEIMSCADVAAQSGGQWMCGPFGDADHTCLPVVDGGDGNATIDAGTLSSGDAAVTSRSAALNMCVANSVDGGAR
jgi:hypothetical protein